MPTAVADRPDQRGPWRDWIPVYSLGLYTITAYGTWAYAFGVLIESIRADTGWSTSFLGSVYGAAMALAGLSAFWAGRLLDRYGPAVPLGLHAIVASGLMLVAVSTSNAWIFGPLFALGAGLGGATGFYAMTTVIAARTQPDRPDRAIAVLTLVGAFCSPIYLPVTARLLTIWDWRTVARLLIVAGTVGAVQAALVVRRDYVVGGDMSGDAGALTNVEAPADQPSARSRDALARALKMPSIRRILAVYFLAGAAASTMWAYQVPILEATGLSLAAAGTLAGLRGFCQLFGRVGLTTAVGHFGATRLLQAAYAITAVGGLALLGAGTGIFDSLGVTTTMLAIVFALLAGTGFGASSPLQAIHARLHFESRDLGLLMGMQGGVLGLAGAVGPIGGSVLRDVSGSWTITLSLIVVILLVSGLLLHSPRAIATASATASATATGPATATATSTGTETEL